MSLGWNHHYCSTIGDPLSLDMGVSLETPKFLLESPRFLMETPDFYLRPHIFIWDSIFSLESPIFSMETPRFLMETPILTSPTNLGFKMIYFLQKRMVKLPSNKRFWITILRNWQRSFDWLFVSPRSGERQAAMSHHYFPFRATY